MSIVFLILVVVFLASAPWVAKGKSLPWRLAQSVGLYIVALGIGWGFEYATTGVMYPQGGFFYVLTACLFAISSLPGVLYRLGVGL